MLKYKNLILVIFILFLSCEDEKNIILDDLKLKDFSPESGVSSIPRSITFKWDINANNFIYNIHLGNSESSLDLIAQKLDSESLFVSGLKPSKEYFWKIEAIDGADTIKSEILKFTTKSIFDNNHYKLFSLDSIKSISPSIWYSKMTMIDEYGFGHSDISEEILNITENGNSILNPDNISIWKSDEGLKLQLIIENSSLIADQYAYKEGLINLIRNLDEQILVSISVYSDNHNVICDFTNDKSLLENKILDMNFLNPQVDIYGSVSDILSINSQEMSIVYFLIAPNNDNLNSVPLNELLNITNKKSFYSTGLVGNKSFIEDIGNCFCLTFIDWNQFNNTMIDMSLGLNSLVEAKYSVSIYSGLFGNGQADLDIGIVNNQNSGQYSRIEENVRFESFYQVEKGIFINQSNQNSVGIDTLELCTGDIQILTASSFKGNKLPNYVWEVESSDILSSILFENEPEKIELVAEKQGISSIVVLDIANNFSKNLTVIVRPSDFYGEITNPKNNEILIYNDEVEFSANAISTGQIDWVDFYKNDSLLFTDHTLPYSCNTLLDKAGENTFKILAYSGNFVTSDSLKINVKTMIPPEVSIVSPSQNQTILEGQSFDFIAEAFDSDGSIKEVNLYLDNSLIEKIYTPPYLTNLMLGEIGSYTLSTQAMDNDSLFSEKKYFDIMISENLSPNGNIETPLDSCNVRYDEEFTIRYNAFDEDCGIEKVEVYIDSLLEYTGTVAPFEFSYKSTKIWCHNIYAKVYDEFGKIGVSDTTSFNVKFQIDEIWSTEYSIEDYHHATKVKETSDNSFLVLGQITRSPFLIKFDENGNFLWKQIYGESYCEDYLNDIIETSDGGYILIGETTSYSQTQNESDMWLVKTDINGNIEWQKTFGTTLFEGGLSIRESRGNYMIMGFKEEPYLEPNHWIMEVDNNGNEQSSEIIPTSPGSNFIVIPSFALNPISISNETYNLVACFIPDEGYGCFVSRMIKQDINNTVEWKKVIGIMGDIAKSTVKMNEQLYVSFHSYSDSNVIRSYDLEINELSSTRYFNTPEMRMNQFNDNFALLKKVKVAQNAYEIKLEITDQNFNILESIVYEYESEDCLVDLMKIDGKEFIVVTTGNNIFGQKKVMLKKYKW
ncbi:MAG: hypothetical protein JXR48_04115 [Candidatus Delongbacteria bacterium]|nr:hypothetical protein [Candidatus Delongbacteria bacterium]MBN2834131.1 hypothetical protein [Candidatus Delongbacteria bacterium]